MTARFAKLLPFAGIIVLGIQLTVWLPAHWRRTDVDSLDFTVYQYTAVRLAEGLPIYGGPHAPPSGFLYPPTFAALVRPAASMSAATFQKVWYALLGVACWAYAWGLARIAFVTPTARQILSVGVLVVLTPGTAITMSLGNADMIVWALVAWALGGGPSVMPLLLGTALKLYPAFGAAIVAVRRKALVCTVVMGTAILALAYVVLGRRPFIEWFEVGASALPPGVFAPGNVSLSIEVLRVVALCTGTRLSMSLPAWGSMILHLLPLVVVGVVTWMTRRWSIRGQAVAVILATAWSAPVCWWYRLPLGLIAGATWWRQGGLARPVMSVGGEGHGY